MCCRLFAAGPGAQIKCQINGQTIHTSESFLQLEKDLAIRVAANGLRESGSNLTGAMCREQPVAESRGNEKNATQPKI